MDKDYFSGKLSGMNQFTQREQAAANIIRRCAKGLAETYASPDDLEAATLALLLVAVDDESGIKQENENEI